MNASRNRAVKLFAVALILLLAAAFFIPGLVAPTRLHPDEALYATYGRMVSHGDWLLSGVLLDKPPLQFYALGLTFELTGISEFSARLPGVFASLLSIAAVYSLTCRLYGSKTALLTIFLLTLSPMMRAFAATAFTDPLLTLFILLSALLAVRRGWRWSGVWIGLAFAVKPSALQWIPLVALLGIMIERGWHWKHIRRFALSFGAILFFLILWQLARATVPDFWTLNGINNNPGRFIRAEEVAPRFARWGAYAMTIFPLFMVGWLSILYPALKHRAELKISPIATRESLFNNNGIAVLFDLILTAYTLGSMAFLWLVAFNTYDRYLLPLAPFLLMLVARVLGRLGTWRAGIVALLLMAFFTPPVHLGGDDGSYTGIDQLAEQLNALPEGSIVYEHWLGWELGYYLGDHPSIQLFWLPTVRELNNSTHPSYLVAPLEESRPWLDELSKAGINFQIFYTSGRFAVFRVGTFAP